MAFVILVTPQPSVIRAAVMAVVVMVTLFSGRPGTGIPLLSVAVIAMLLWDPWWAVEYGFILSVIATAGLLLFSGPLGHSLSRWMPVWLATLIAIPLAAQLMCQPIIILLSPQVPTYGVLANILATPLAPIATIVGLLACVLLWFPPISHVLLWVAWLPAEWIGQTALVLSHLPLAQIPWFSGPWGSFVSAVLSSLILIVLLSQKPVVRRVSAFLLVLSLSAWAMTTVIRNFSFRSALPSEWSIATCDVGQGDALVLRSQDNIAVIDVGRKPEPMKRCLDQLGITRIDLLVLTHFDKDHVGGLSAVMGKVDHAVVGKPENLEDQSLLRELSRGGAKLERAVQGMTGTLGDSSWKVLWPDGEHPSIELGNPGSVIMLFSFPTFRALFLGDLGKEAQQALMQSHSLPKAHVVKVAHHGSADQSQALYEELQPDIALFSVGEENDYGHPRSETLEIMKSQGAFSPRTDLDGLILVSVVPSGLSVWTEH
jgi:competence protein ComEC